MSVYTCIYTHLSSPPIPQDRLKQLNGVEDVQSSPSRPSLQPEPEPVKQLYVRSELLLLLGHWIYDSQYSQTLHVHVPPLIHCRCTCMYIHACTRACTCTSCTCRSDRTLYTRGYKTQMVPETVCATPC